MHQGSVNAKLNCCDAVQSALDVRLALHRNKIRHIDIRLGANTNVTVLF